MARLFLTLLGGFAARLEPGTALALPARKTTALLAYLAMPAGQPHPREKLVALLWSDADSSRARNAVRQVLFNLRRTVAPADALRLVGETVTLDPDAVDVDVAAFEQEVASGSLEALERGVALYRGDLLAGLPRQEPPFEEWLLTQRERLRELALEAMARLLARQREEGALDRSVNTALRLLALDPIQETVHRTLMRLYADTGRRGAALRQYQVCVTSLQRELGIEPEPETKELYQHILRLRPGRTSGAPSSISAGEVEATGGTSSVSVPATDQVPLVGRTREMARLRGALEGAIGGRGSLIAILAEGGMGKSRLVEELGTEAARRTSILRGRAYEAAQILSYGPWVEALQAARVAEDQELLGSLDSIRRAELGRVLPGVASSPPGGPGEHLHAFEAMALLFERMSRRQPLVFVLEDLHWGDEMSVRFLGFLGRRIHASRLLGVVTMREEDLEVAPFLRRTLEDLERSGELALIRLAPLSRAETTELARRIAPRAMSDDGEARERIWRMSGGSPFIVVEAMGMIHEGSVPDAAGVVMSERVRQLVGRRLERLGSPGRQLAAAAAVLGRESEFELLRTTARLDAEQAAEGLEELVRHRILHQVGESFGFTHDHVRAVVYGGLLSPRRVLLHRRAAELIEEGALGDLTAHLETLGVHYRLGETWNKAAGYLERAGRAAAAKSAHRSAATAYGEAIDAVNHLPDSEERRARACDLHFSRAYSFGWSGAIDDSLEEHRRSLAMAESLGDSSRLQRTLTGTCSALASTGRYAEALAAGQRALAMATTAADASGQFWVNINLARICYAIGDYRAAVDHGRQSESCLARAPALSGAVTQDLPPSVAYRSWLVLSLAMLGDFATGSALGEDLTRLIAAMDWPRARASASVSLGHLWLAKGDLSAAISTLEPTVRLCREAELWAFFARAGSALGVAQALDGRPAAGRPLIEEAVSQSRSTGYLYLQPSLLCDLATAHLVAEDLDEAERVALDALTLARIQGARGGEAEALRLVGEIAMRRDPPDFARASVSLEESLDLAYSIGGRPAAARGRLALGILHRRSGRASRSREELEIAAREFRSMAMNACLARAQAELGSGQSS